MSIHPHRPFLVLPCAIACAALFLSVPRAGASIERLALPTMIAKADGAVVGTITRKRVIRIDHPKDGAELYFTFLTIDGHSLADGASLAVDVIFAGGFVDAQHGVFNSEAPSADDVALGRRVVAFYKYTPNMGGDLAGNALYAAHGGLYRTFDSQGGTIVLGRGDGYAIEGNTELATLEARVVVLAREKLAREQAERARREHEQRVREDGHRAKDERR